MAASVASTASVGSGVADGEEPGSDVTSPVAVVAAGEASESASPASSQLSAVLETEEAGAGQEEQNNALYEEEENSVLYEAEEGEEGGAMVLSGVEGAVGALGAPGYAEQVFSCPCCGSHLQLPAGAAVAAATTRAPADVDAWVSGDDQARPEPPAGDRSDHEEAADGAHAWTPAEAVSPMRSELSSTPPVQRHGRPAASRARVEQAEADGSDEAAEEAEAGEAVGEAAAAEEAAGEAALGVGERRFGPARRPPPALLRSWCGCAALPSLVVVRSCHCLATAQGHGRHIEPPHAHAQRAAFAGGGRCDAAGKVRQGCAAGVR